MTLAVTLVSPVVTLARGLDPRPARNYRRDPAIAVPADTGSRISW